MGKEKEEAKNDRLEERRRENDLAWTSSQPLVTHRKRDLGTSNVQLQYIVHCPQSLMHTSYMWEPRASGVSRKTESLLASRKSVGSRVPAQVSRRS